MLRLPYLVREQHRQQAAAIGQRCRRPEDVRDRHSVGHAQPIQHATVVDKPCFLGRRGFDDGV